MDVVTRGGFHNWEHGLTSLADAPDGSIYWQDTEDRLIEWCKHAGKWWRTRWRMTLINEDGAEETTWT